MSNSIYEQQQFDDKLPLSLIHLDSADKFLPWVRYPSHNPLDIIHYIPSHWHRNLEIIYIKKGAVKLSMENHNKVYKAGEFILINSGDIHEISNIPGGEVEVIALIISFDYCTQVEPQFGKLRFDINESPGTYPKLIALFESIATSFKRDDQYIHHLIRSRLDLLLYYLLRDFQDKNSDSLETQEFIHNQTRHKEVLNYVHLHYASPLKLEVLAKHFDMSREHFSRKFKDVFGKTFLEYLFDYRICRAFQDIVCTQLTMEQISQMHGFPSSKGMISQFKKRYATTPNEFRKYAIISDVDLQERPIIRQFSMYINKTP